MIRLGLIILTLGMALPGSAWSQEASETPGVAAMGRVVDQETGQPVEGAYVAFEGARWGTYTDETGLFYMRDPKGGSPRITIEMLGYGTTYVPLSFVDEAPPIRIPVRADPIVLEGFEIVTDRFARRRKAAPTSVRSFDERQLRAAPSLDIVEFLGTRSFVRPAPCGSFLATGPCARVRGRVVPVIICVDEVPMFGGFDMLRSISPSDLAMAEVYGSGRQIRLYTRAFMENASRVRLNPHPIEFGC